MQPDPRNHPPTSQVGKKDPQAPATTQNENEVDWLDLAQKAYRGSTDYMNTTYRKQWDDSLRAFNNQHPTDSKYSQPAYDKRSKIYRPRTRAVIRKNEAAAAAAFFSNMDVVSVTAQDPSSKTENASADVMKELLQYRLSKTIPWYQTVLGGFQDSQTVGLACAHICWEYQESEPEAVEAVVEVSAPQQEAEGDDEYPAQDVQELPGNSLVADKEGGLQEQQMPAAAVQAAVKVAPNILVDRPRIELIPLENIRFSEAANWMDIVGTSPYLIHLMPMFVLDVKEKMESGEWIKYGDAVLSSAGGDTSDSTRMSRNRGDDQMKGDATVVDDYSIVWVQRHIHRREGADWEFYTLSDQAMLTDARPLEETVFHGKRPYVIGACILETHHPVPTSVPTLGKGLQDEINEIANQRIDNVKFVLNKKWFVKRGKEADVQGLVRNVPGGVVMLDDPINDVREITWPDVTASSFQENQALNQEFDELLGNFNPAALMTQGAGNSPARNMSMLANSQGTLVEYMLRTFVETFVQPVLRQLVLLEQEYETDQVLLKIAGKRAEITQRYGIDEVTDDLLANELTLTVNVGMGATDPMQKLQKFLTAMTTYTQMLTHPAPGINMQEVGKEIFGMVGYADGSRFFTNDNPQIAALQQQLQQATQVAQQLQQKLSDRSVTQQTKLAVAKMNNETGVVKTKIQEEAANKRALATHITALSQVAGKEKGLQPVKRAV